jgi:N-acetylglucosamine kinase-like BadF-type ATPase
MRAIAVGVDAGGTSTKASASRDGDAYGRAQGAAANASAIGFERAAAAIASVIEEALQGESAQAICVGAAGAGRKEVSGAFEAELRKRFPGARVCVCDDARIALRAAVPDGDGIVLISGTGSIAYGEFGESVVRAGGYGYLVGDEGSGFAIGSAAVRLLLRSYDGRSIADAFTAQVAAALGSSCANDVLERVYRNEHPVRALAALAPMVIEAANAGQRAANKILQAAALDLSDLVKSLLRAADAGRSEIPIVFAGGLLRDNSLLTYLLETRLINEHPFLHAVKGAAAPQFGALALAQRMLT